MSLFSTEGADPTRPVVVRHTEVETLGVPAASMRLLSDGDAADPRTLSAIRTTMGRNVDGPPPHFHVTAPEIFFIIEGGLNVLVGSDILSLRTGDYLVVPAHVPHAFATPESTGVDMLFMMSGIERFEYFRLGDRVMRGHASPQEILDGQDRFDNHFQDSKEWREFRS